jgi:hypothetical protein
VTYEPAQVIIELLDWKAEEPESVPLVTRDRRKILTDPRVNSMLENLRRGEKESARGRKLYYRLGYGNQYELQLSCHKQEGTTASKNFMVKK